MKDALLIYLIFDSLIPVIILKTLRFRSSALFGIHTLLNKSFRVLLLPTQLYKLTENG